MPTNAKTIAYGLVLRDTAGLYAAPDMTPDPVSRLKSGTLVDVVTKRKDSWRQVRLRDGSSGWVVSLALWEWPSPLPQSPATLTSSSPNRSLEISSVAWDCGRSIVGDSLDDCSVKFVVTLTTKTGKRKGLVDVLCQAVTRYRVVEELGGMSFNSTERVVGLGQAALFLSNGWGTDSVWIDAGEPRGVLARVTEANLEYLACEAL